MQSLPTGESSLQIVAKPQHNVATAMDTGAMANVAPPTGTLTHCASTSSKFHV